MNVKSNRNGALDVIRIVATVIILFHHFQQITDAYYPGYVNYYRGAFYWGYIVELFFVLSGFLSVKNIQSIQNGKTFGQFYLDRLFRFLPLLAAGAVVYEGSVYVFQRITGGVMWLGAPLDFFGMVLDSLALQEGWGFPGTCVNYPTWYISVLMLCYVFLWLTTWLAKKLDVSPVPLYVFMILAGVYVLNGEKSWMFFNAMTGRGYTAFFTGILLGIFLEKNQLSRSVICGAALCIAVCVFVIAKKQHLLPTGLLMPLTFLVYPPLIVLMSTKVMQHVFRHPIWGWLGTITFDVFIWHSPLFPIMFSVIRWLNLDIDFSKRYTMYLYALVCFALGALSYRFINQPTQRWIAAKRRQRTENTDAPAHNES